MKNRLKIVERALELAVTALVDEAIAAGAMPIETAPKDGSDILGLVTDEDDGTAQWVTVRWGVLGGEGQWLVNYAATPICSFERVTAWHAVPGIPQ